MVHANCEASDSPLLVGAMLTVVFTRPQGYEKDHRDIELLRLRSFTIGKKLDDSAVMGAGGLQRIADLISCMVPFVSPSTQQHWMGESLLPVYRRACLGAKEGARCRKESRRCLG